MIRLQKSRRRAFVGVRPGQLVDRQPLRSGGQQFDGRPDGGADSVFEEIAPIVERTPAATRQLASRARRRVRGAAPTQEPDLAKQREVVAVDAKHDLGIEHGNQRVEISGA